jgi:hypothetical protein
VTRTRGSRTEPIPDPGDHLGAVGGLDPRVVTDHQRADADPDVVEQDLRDLVVIAGQPDLAVGILAVGIRSVGIRAVGIRAVGR